MWLDKNQVNIYTPVLTHGGWIRGFEKLKQKSLNSTPKTQKRYLKHLWTRAPSICVRTNEPTTHDIQSGSGDNLGAQKQGAANFEQNSNMLRQVGSSRRCGSGMWIAHCRNVPGTFLYVYERFRNVSLVRMHFYCFFYTVMHFLQITKHERLHSQ